MAGLGPAIHEFASNRRVHSGLWTLDGAEATKLVDARAKPWHDDREGPLGETPHVTALGKWSGPQGAAGGFVFEVSRPLPGLSALMSGSVFEDVLLSSPLVLP
jgi:hypothetical protein